jgi:hypothetical protein
MTTRPSLKSLAATGAAAEQQTRPAMPPPGASTTSRLAQTREGSRQVSAHFKADVAQALRMLAAEQDREQQELLAEALNMLFERYGKATRAEVLGTRRKRS